MEIRRLPQNFVMKPKNGPAIYRFYACNTSKTTNKRRRNTFSWFRSSLLCNLIKIHATGSILRILESVRDKTNLIKLCNIFLLQHSKKRRRNCESHENHIRIRLNWLGFMDIFVAYENCMPCECWSNHCMYQRIYPTSMWNQSYKVEFV